MKAKVVVKFKDKKKGSLHQIGEEITLNKDRFKEINSTKYGTILVSLDEENKEE